MSHNKNSLAGVDEVGRGPLAGDVVAAAVILGENHGITDLADSKKLSEKKRNVLFDLIQEKAIAFCVARASVAEIDTLNILQASLLAMKRAVDGLKVSPEFVLVDGNKLPDWSFRSEAIVQGDGKIEEISAASILAKVTRDRELIELDNKYPNYGLAQHKGYPTRLHLEALKQFGPSPIHRRSFAPVKDLLSVSKPSLQN